MVAPDHSQRVQQSSWRERSTGHFAHIQDAKRYDSVAAGRRPHMSRRDGLQGERWSLLQRDRLQRNRRHEHPGDDADLTPEVFVGRAPVTTPGEAWIFVDKTLQYERTPAGDYFHIYTESFAERFFFEIVQRNGYDAYGAMNAPARMASQAQQGAQG